MTIFYFRNETPIFNEIEILYMNFLNVIITVFRSFNWNSGTAANWGLIYDFKIVNLIFPQIWISYNFVTVCLLQYAAVSFEVWAGLEVEAQIW